MPDLQVQAQIDAANAYEALFVPALFQAWAPRVVQAARIEPGQRVLDVACGTGVLAREALARTGKSGSVTGIDLNAGMLEVARQHAPSVTWQEAAAESLPFPDASFDAVVSQFGMMFFTDRPRAIREMLRVLRSDGRLAVAVWDALERSPLYTTVVALLDRIGGTPAGDALRAPFVLGDERALVSLFEGAGVADVRVESRVEIGRFPDIRTLVEAELRGWLPIVGVNLSEDQITRILADAEHELRPYRTPDGVRFEMPALIVTGRNR